MAVKQKITELLKRLNDGVYEKEEVIALTLLSAVAGERILVKYLSFQGKVVILWLILTIQSI